MNWLDFLILALVAWLTLSAYMTGLIRETVGLASVILGVAMAGLFHDNVATNLALLTGEGAGAEIGAYLLIFAVVLTIGFVASFVLRSATRLFFLGWADHAGGALFGFFKGVLIVQAVIVIFVLQQIISSRYKPLRVHPLDLAGVRRQRDVQKLLDEMTLSAHLQERDRLVQHIVGRQKPPFPFRAAKYAGGSLMTIVAFDHARHRCAGDRRDPPRFGIR